MSDAVARTGAAMRAAEGWVADVVAQVASAPWPVAALLLVAGVAALLVGARFRRPLAAAGGAVVGAAGAVLLGEPLGHAASLSPEALAGLVAAAAGAACGIAPVIFPLLAGALPGALAATVVAPPDQRLLALGLGAAVGAGLGLLLVRWVAAAVAAGVGALAAAVGLAALLQAAGAGRALAAHPAAVLGTAVVLAVAGAAFQLPRAWEKGASGGPRARAGAPPTPDREARSPGSPA